MHDRIDARLLAADQVAKLQSKIVIARSPAARVRQKSSERVTDAGRDKPNHFMSR
jgi:hypothetical protein